MSLFRDGDHVMDTQYPDIIGTIKSQDRESLGMYCVSWPDGSISWIVQSRLALVARRIEPTAPRAQTIATACAILLTLPAWLGVTAHCLGVL